MQQQKLHFARLTSVYPDLSKLKVRTTEPGNRQPPSVQVGAGAIGEVKLLVQHQI